MLRYIILVALAGLGTGADLVASPNVKYGELFYNLVIFTTKVG